MQEERPEKDWVIKSMRKQLIDKFPTLNNPKNRIIFHNRKKKRLI